jgi:hypothetical protein
VTLCQRPAKNEKVVDFHYAHLNDCVLIVFIIQVVGHLVQISKYITNESTDKLIDTKEVNVFFVYTIR